MQLKSRRKSVKSRRKSVKSRSKSVKSRKFFDGMKRKIEGESPLILKKPKIEDKSKKPTIDNIPNEIITENVLSLLDSDSKKAFNLSKKYNYSEFRDNKIYSDFSKKVENTLKFINKFKEIFFKNGPENIVFKEELKKYGEIKLKFKTNYTKDNTLDRTKDFVFFVKMCIILKIKSIL